MAQDDAPTKSSFAAVADSRTRLLVLGSLPGDASLAQAQYYAHPRNQFWRLIGAVVDADLSQTPYTERLDRLKAAGIGLWDVIGSAQRVGSLDASIRRPTANPLAEFVSTLPGLRAVAFNGGLASQAGRRLLAEEASLALVALPSSSPAYTLPFAQKLDRWRKLRAYLDPVS